MHFIADDSASLQSKELRGLFTSIPLHHKSQQQSLRLVSITITINKHIKADWRMYMTRTRTTLFQTMACHLCSAEPMLNNKWSVYMCMLYICYIIHINWNEFENISVKKTVGCLGSINGNELRNPWKTRMIYIYFIADDSASYAVQGAGYSRPYIYHTNVTKKSLRLVSMTIN